jgi:hypothetical protein
LIPRLAVLFLAFFIAAATLAQTPRPASPGLRPPKDVSLGASSRGFGPQAGRPEPPSREAQFRELAGQLQDARLGGGAESRPREEQALALLDGFVLEGLNATGGADLEALNRKLSGLVTRQPALGEGYRVSRIGKTPPAYALLVDFGLSGPSAVRIYVGPPGHARFAAGIDRYSYPDFLDDYLELVPVDPAEGVFATVAGRTDALATGSFMAWRFDGSRVEKLWTSDILQQSSYEARSSAFQLSYCGRTDDRRPEICLRMVKDLYRYEDGRWQRVREKALPLPGK